MKNTILVVDDESAIRDMLHFALTQAGHEVLMAADAMAARVIVADTPPDLMLLDWMMPKISGIELARRFKRDELTRDIPIIMLTARGEEDDRVRGLEVGADDYVCKPFSTRELLARVNAVLRRSQPDADAVLQVGLLSVDLSSARVLSDSAVVHLGPTEYKLLLFLMRQPDRVFSRTQLLDNVWGTNIYVEDRTVDVHIRRLRKALEPTGTETYVQTVRGMGYRFSEQVS